MFSVPQTTLKQLFFLLDIPLRALAIASRRRGQLCQRIGGKKLDLKWKLKKRL
jgi:hypothetical protein